MSLFCRWLKLLCTVVQEPALRDITSTTAHVPVTHVESPPAQLDKPSTHRSACVSASIANAQMGKLSTGTPASANVLVNFTAPGQKRSTQTTADVSARETKHAKLRLHTTRSSADACARKDNTVQPVKCSATENVGAFVFFREIAQSHKSSIPRPADVDALQLSYA